MKIKFGTSGWRAIIADEFTYDNVKLVTQAIADYVNLKQPADVKVREVIVGYDTRFMSEEYAKTASRVLAANGIRALCSKRDVPTPVVAYEIIRRGTAGGMNFTASHNPPEYNGIKFSPDWGGPALPETTTAIEKRCEELMSDRSAVKEMSWEDGLKRELIEVIDPRPAYLKRIKELIDVKAIKKAKLKAGVDLLYGTSRGYLDELLDYCGVRQEILHECRDVLFGGHRPEPDEERLAELKKLIKSKRLNIGLSCDGDADRFGIIDSNGAFIAPNQVIALVLYHLAENKKWRGVVARSVMTTHLIDALAAHYGISVSETPVGFKYIGDVMVNNKNTFIVGGEESGGLTIRGHVPEKDGMLACMLMAELMAYEKKTFTGILKKIEKMVGKYITKRVNFSLTPELMSRFREQIKSNPPSEFAGIKVKETVLKDGFKFILEDNSWVGMRLSGTEPVVRLYIEAGSAAKLKALEKASNKIITG
jgi:alpha-D-glucose phosphate-specific phosphoglucomutase